MPRALAWILIAIASLRLAGGDLLVLQVAAWSGMIATRTAEQGLTEAVKTTFDGDHPCRLCSMVKEAAVTEEKSPATSSSSKAPAKGELTKLKEFVPMSRWPCRRPMRSPACPRQNGSITSQTGVMMRPSFRLPGFSRREGRCWHLRAGLRQLMSVLSS